MTTTIVTSTWDDKKVRLFKTLAQMFNDSAEHHHGEYNKWNRISILCTMITMSITFSSLCVELIFRDHPVVKYYGFADKIIIMIVTSFIFAVDPDNVSNKHDKSCSSYLELVSRIIAQLNRDTKARKNVDILLTEIKSKYDFIVEQNHPPPHLRFPVSVWSMSDQDIKLLGSLYDEHNTSSVIDILEPIDI